MTDPRQCSQCGLPFAVPRGQIYRKTCSPECRADHLRAYQREYARTRTGRSGENTRRQGAQHTTQVVADTLDAGDRYTLDPAGARGWRTAGSLAVIGDRVHVRLKVGPLVAAASLAAAAYTPVEKLDRQQLITLRTRRNG